jgi:hypothetical protein
VSHRSSLRHSEVRIYYVLESQELSKPGLLELLLTVYLGRECGPSILSLFGSLPVRSSGELSYCVVKTIESQGSEAS